MRKVLYIDACVNRASSRTEGLARFLLDRLDQTGECQIETLVLEDEPIAPLDSETLNHRTACIERGDFSDPLFCWARQVAEVDDVVFAAPYWDFSFPSKLKCYLEMLCAQGVTFEYSDQGIPRGLCKGTRVFYITTSGGPIMDFDFGYAQVEAIFKFYFGFSEFVRIAAEGLDIVGNDIEGILADARASIASLSL